MSHHLSMANWFKVLPPGGAGLKHLRVQIQVETVRACVRHHISGLGLARHKRTNIGEHKGERALALF